MPRLLQFPLLLLATMFVASSAHGQIVPAVAERLDQLEREWLKEPDPEIRKKASVRLEPLLLALFTGQSGKASLTLDCARRVIARKSESTAWADALQMTVAKSILDPVSDSLTVTLNRVYETPMPKHRELVLNIEFVRGQTKVGSHSRMISSFPFTESMTLPQGAGPLSVNWAMQLDGQLVPSLPHRSPRVVSVPDLSKRLKELSLKRLLVEKIPRSLSRQTWLFHHDRLCAHGAGTTLVNDIDLDNLLLNLENASLTSITSGAWPTPLPNLNMVLVLPCKGGDSIVRVVLPGNFKPSHSPHPLLVALHSAGNSEDQFVVGNAEQFTKRCSHHGWILASPRSGIVQDMQQHLEAWLGVATGPMALMGHSQGAAQALAFAAQTPQNIRAVVALGGSGRSGNGAAYQKIRMFLGIGSRDMALKAVSNLAAQLQTDGVTLVELHTYDGVEHVLVTLASIDDVFRFLQKAMAPISS